MGKEEDVLEALFLPSLPLLTLETEETGKKEHKTNPICLSTPGRERGEEGEGEGGEKARTRVWDSSTFRLER